jgi:hypothetical protein
MVLLFLVCGCKAIRAPIGRPAGYPANWPELSSAGVNAHAWEGKYANWGEWTPRTRPPFVGGLTRLLPDSAFTAVQAVSLRVELKRGKPGNSSNTVLFLGSGEGAGYYEQPFHCLWLKHGLLFFAQKTQESLNDPFHSSEYQQNVFLVKAVDGSLVARIMDQETHVAMIVPWINQTYSWVRFEKIK